MTAAQISHCSGNVMAGRLASMMRKTRNRARANGEAGGYFSRA
jgi:hypothetical protein